MNIIKAGAEVKCHIQSAKADLEKVIKEKSIYLERGRYENKAFFTDKIQKIKNNLTTHLYIIEVILIFDIIVCFIK